MGRPKTPIEDRFWPKVRKTRGCWEWTANVFQRSGYGRISEGPNGEHLSHRVSYILTKGPIPKGLDVLHKCDNKRCVRPSHLFLGSHSDNMKDMVSKGRSLKGSKNPPSKLVEADAIEIRRLYATRRYSQQKIADLYGVNQTLIGFIVRRVYWTHV